MNDAQRNKNQHGLKLPKLTPKEEKVAKLTLLALLCTIGAWLSLFLPLPWTFLGFIPIIGIFISVVLIPINAFGTKLQKRSFLTAFIYTIPALISCAILLFSAFFYSPLKEAQDCRENAITAQALKKCNDLIPGANNNQ